MARKISQKAALDALAAALRLNHDAAANHADTLLAPLRVQAMDYYNAAPFGDEVEGRSAWVQSELSDTVLATMPHLLRVFASRTSSVFRLRRARRTKSSRPRR
jgi:hypothetical protein